MNKSNKLRKLSGAIVALCCAATFAQASESVVVGPVDALGESGSSITVLGQTFLLRSSHASIYRSFAQRVGGTTGLLVLAKGELAEDGRLVARSIEPLESSYVPGASSVFLQGKIDSYDESLGILQVGDLSIFVSQALADSTTDLRVGAAIEVIGTQALAFGPVWATAVVPVNEAGDEGTANSINSSRASTQAIVGTGKQTQAIVGTGKQTQAIVGTGKQTQAIVGTGASALAIVGTGKQDQVIVGTGASTLAIVGTGKQTQAIVGTGVSALAIVGTGKQAQAIVGTGASALAIVGTGKQTQAIVGTGKQTQAIVGTGKQTQAIVGTGVAAFAIVGTGK